jgi:hypothetical protein
MDAEFVEKIKRFSERVSSIIDSIQNEESTKTSIILPFFQILGYDVFNPQEFLPEFTADVGIKKGERVDYAILKDGEPLILIEAKPINDDLKKHDSQLFRYFSSTKAKFAILTNGVIYKFFTDLDETNKMDSKPFFVFHLLELRENNIAELQKFRKNVFDIDNILNTASELRYTNDIKELLKKEIESPSDEFIVFFLSHIYEGRKTQNVIDSFRTIVKKSINQFITERVNDKLQAALDTSKAEAASPKTDHEGNAELKDKGEIVTTEEEIEGYVHVKMILKDVIDPERIYYRDNLRYLNVLIDDNIRKWVCRLLFNTSNKRIQLNDDLKTQYKINSLEDIYLYKDQIIEVANKFLD